MRRSVPILLYHHVAADREITSAVLERQLRSMLDQGCQCFSMDQLLNVLRGDQRVTAPAFVVTFDDGYQDNWAHAFPVLKELSLPATMYVVTDRIGTEGFLSWSDIETMASSGLVTFGSHTRTHRHFVRRETYANLDDELRQSKAILEEKLGKSCDHLAWPWGDYETAWLPLVKAIGYRSAATTLSGANGEGKDPYKLKRINIRKPELDWFHQRLNRNQWALSADVFGQFNGLDRRLKVWWNNETPYSHG
jgi:peptidoglycan/xylan/chitin deacetylase (PgdA/CDA1 family)